MIPLNPQIQGRPPSSSLPISLLHPSPPSKTPITAVIPCSPALQGLASACYTPSRSWSLTLQTSFKTTFHRFFPFSLPVIETLSCLGEERSWVSAVSASTPLRPNPLPAARALPGAVSGTIRWSLGYTSQSWAEGSSSSRRSNGDEAGESLGRNAQNLPAASLRHPSSPRNKVLTCGGW